MKLDNNNISNFDNFIVRFDNKKFQVTAIVFTLFFAGIILFTFKSFASKGLTEIIFTLLIFFLPISYFWFLAFDKRVKILIDKTGIWTKKNGHIDWSNVWYFSLDEEKADKGENLKFLYFKLVDNNKLFKISIENYDKNKIEIHDAIAKYSKNFNIIDLGYSSDF